MESVLVLSWKAIGNVPAAVKELRARDLRPVLVSNLPDDPNARLCDEHVVFDWDGEEFSALTAQIDERGITPTAVVSMIEKLIEWHIALAAHYGVPGGDAGRTALASKTLVRERMRSLGLSDIRFSGDPRSVDFFPAIVKPARESAASYLVKRVEDRAELLAHLKHLEESGAGGLELIAEEYLPGTEFSVDGPVVDGRYHPLLAVEKADHDDAKHHDAGLSFHPPQHSHVRAGVRDLCEAINTLCADRGLDQIWLHIEGRSTPDGRTELIEINPRPGGHHTGIPTAIRELYGIDVIAANVSMALGEYAPQGLGPLREQPIIGNVEMEAEELGTVQVVTTEAELLALPGVIDVRVSDGYRVTSLSQENFFFSLTMTADSVEQLREQAARVLDSFEYRVKP
ncbi:phosphoribosylglycinamide synthetase [Catenulispora acidiphila DSM 44928]|uniref:Phosphoribosylglycinamide synthetase n=1 Tax=Catenulispora acidiphila (strain DSM 44928 / JCM 14897 / NBRC 102108 / NRRL B-24433 / ID139908) TaxID=479433 RepID=C7Q3P0_CATAD|nr:ATP-grasp domain-containing protein [Catenulispora acidiphila]ACU75805.1 phosphoribosylglycinamide synthetase [Catenulispora acidiphila DSM 44928]